MIWMMVPSIKMEMMKNDFFVCFVKKKNKIPIKTAIFLRKCNKI